MNFPPTPSIEHRRREPSDPPATAGIVRGDPSAESLDLGAILGALWRRKLVLMLSAALAAIAGYISVIDTPTSYTASARLLFEPERVKLINLENVVTTPDTTAVGLQNQIEIMRSAGLLERVAARLNLETTPEFNWHLRPAPKPLSERALGHLKVVAADVSQTFGISTSTVSPTRGGPEADAGTATHADPALHAEIAQQLASKLSLSVIYNSRVIQVGYTTTNPELAAAIVNAVGDEYIRYQVDNKKADVSAAVDLLHTRVQDLERRLHSAEEEAEAARLDFAVAAAHGVQLAGQQLQTLSSALASARMDAADLAARHDRASAAAADEGTYGIIPEFRESSIISGYRNQEREILSEIASMRAVGSGANPDLTRLTVRLAEVRAHMRAETENIVAALALNLASARSKQSNLEADVRDLEARALEQSRAELRLHRMEREAQSIRALHDRFVDRLEQVTEQANLQSAEARFLARANPPGAPDASTASRFVIMASAGGLMVGLGAVFLLERLNTSFRSSDDLEATSGHLVLGVIPKVGRRKKIGQLIQEILQDPGSHLAEATRHLRTSILYANSPGEPKVLMITSSVPEEGKTTTSMLLAITSQQMGRSAVIVDCDLRRRALADVFIRDPSRPGLMAALSGAASVEEAVFEEPESGLHILTAGPLEHAGRNPADLLASERFRVLVARLRARYDLVILDTPPTLVVADARIVARVADAVLYLVKWGGTSRDEVLEGLRDLALSNSHIIGTAISIMDARRSTHSGYAGYYQRSHTQKKIGRTG